MLATKFICDFPSAYFYIFYILFYINSYISSLMFTWTACAHTTWMHHVYFVVNITWNSSDVCAVSSSLIRAGLLWSCCLWQMKQMLDCQIVITHLQRFGGIFLTLGTWEFQHGPDFSDFNVHQYINHMLNFKHMFSFPDFRIRPWVSMVYLCWTHRQIIC